MRQIHKQREEAPGRKAREPLAEGVAKKRRPFTQVDIEHIMRGRGELEKEGMTDRRIAGILAREMKRSESSIEKKISELVCRKLLADNRNKREQRKFSDEDVELIAGKRAELEKGGMNDTQIAKRIAGGMRWNFGSVLQKIRQLESDGRLGENGNKRIRRKLKRFSGEDVTLIMARRAELEKGGMNDGQISERIAGEMKRDAKTLESKIRKLVTGGVLASNTNMTKRFTNDEVALIARKRGELEKGGMNDWQIAKRIAGEMGKNADSVGTKIRELVDGGQLARNANKRDAQEFSEEEIASIAGERIELEKEGMKDQQIAERIAGEMGRSVGSIATKIRRMVRDGKITRNGNKKEKRSNKFFTNMGDARLVEYAKNEMGKNGVGTRSGLENLDSGLYGALLKRGLVDAVFSDIEQKKRNEILGQLREAVDLYTGEGK